MKRISCRAIIIENDIMVSMYRKLKDRIFYTFPGGGLEENESEEEFVAREVFEEFGLNVQPVKKVYTYESERSIEHFYLCNVVGGEFGKGAGEEFHNNNNGVYKPTKIKLEEIKNLPLMPPEVREALILDYKNFGKNLRNDVLFINGKMV